MDPAEEPRERRQVSAGDVLLAVALGQGGSMLFGAAGGVEGLALSLSPSNKVAFNGPGASAVGAGLTVMVYVVGGSIVGFVVGLPLMRWLGSIRTMRWLSVPLAVLGCAVAVYAAVQVRSLVR